jgi:hypothetical protein
LDIGILWSLFVIIAFYSIDIGYWYSLFSLGFRFLLFSLRSFVFFRLLFSKRPDLFYFKVVLI